MSDNYTEMTPEDVSVSSEKDLRWAHEGLEHNKQRRRHKTWIFYTTLIGCFCMLFCFCCLVLCSERVLGLINASPFAIILITLMGGIPTILLAVVFKGVFHITEKDENVISKKDIETFKEVIMMCKNITQ